MKAILLTLISIPIFLHSCNDVAKESIYEKSIVLNSQNNKNLDSLNLLTTDDIVEIKKDSISLQRKKTFHTSLHFANDSTWVVLNFGKDGFTNVVMSGNNIGCVKPDPEILFVWNDNVKFDLKLISGDVYCENFYGMKPVFSPDEDLFYLYGKTFAKHLDKIRVVKTDSTYLDLILNSSDKRELELFFNSYNDKL